MTRMVTHQKPATRPMVRVQRVSKRDNPGFDGATWGQPNWPDTAADTAANITELVFPGRRVAPFYTLASLKANSTYGDGADRLPYNGAASFTTGQYVRLGDGSQAYWVGGATDAWSAGTAP